MVFLTAGVLLKLPPAEMLPLNPLRYSPMDSNCLCEQMETFTGIFEALAAVALLIPRLRFGVPPDRGVVSDAVYFQLRVAWFSLPNALLGSDDAGGAEGPASQPVVSGTWTRPAASARGVYRLPTRLGRWSSRRLMWDVRIGPALWQLSQLWL